jgi:hypothetical protein
VTLSGPGAGRDKWQAQLVSLPGNVGTILTSELAVLSQVVQDLTDEDMVAGTGCRGWRVADLVVHLGADTEALLVALACPIEEPADRDYLSWWRDWPHEGAVSFDSVRASWARTSSYPSGGSEQGLCRERATRIELAFSAWETAHQGFCRTAANGCGTKAQFKRGARTGANSYGRIWMRHKCAMAGPGAGDRSAGGRGPAVGGAGQRRRVTIEEAVASVLMSILADG